MSEIKNGGLDQYGVESFKLQQFGTAGVEGVKSVCNIVIIYRRRVSCISINLSVIKR